MKFDRAQFSIKSSTRFKRAITFDARCFLERNPPRKQKVTRGKKTFSWDRKENDNSIYDNNDGDTCNSKIINKYQS